MKAAAFTLVQNDMIILELWCKYYSKNFEYLYAHCFNTKKEYIPKLEEFRNKYHLDYYIHPGEQDSPPACNEIVKIKQQELLKKYDWVIYTNCDEFVVPSFTVDSTLTDFMNRCKKDWAWCIGYDVIQIDEPVLDYSKPILDQRKYWIKNPNINKVLLSKKPLNWGDGQHQTDETHGLTPEDMGNMGLYLIHLKHADLNNTVRDLGPAMTGVWPCVVERMDTKEEIPIRFKRFI